MTEIVKCDSCGVDTPATGFCRVDGFTDSDGFWRSGSFNVAVGLCDPCVKAWDVAESVQPADGDSYNELDEDELDEHGFTLENGVWWHCGEYVRGSVTRDSFAECRVCDAVIEWSELPGVES